MDSPADAVASAQGVRFPIVVKPNIGGSGAGVKRFDNVQQLQESAENGQLDLGLDSTALVQEFIPARAGHIVPLEVVGCRYLYGITAHLTADTFHLCPTAISKPTRTPHLNRTPRP